MNSDKQTESAGGFINPVMSLTDAIEDKAGVEKRKGTNSQGSKYKSPPVLPKYETIRLRKWLRLLFYPAVEFRGKSCSFNILNILIFGIQLVKLVLVTVQMFHFGDDRQSFSSLVNRGHIVLRHLLLKDWDSSWEGLPYPPSRGDYAVYNIKDIKDGINFAVSQYYNAETEATGYYVRQNLDNMTIHLKYFDFPGFIDLDHIEGLNIYELTVPVNKGLQLDNDNASDTHYTYDISTELAFWNLTQPFKRILSVRLTFSIHSVRIFDETLSARCLNVLGWITFVDDTNNGQVQVDLETLTTRQECASLGYHIEDADLQDASVSLGRGVIGICCISLILTCAMVVFSIWAFVKTKRYMKRNYKAFYRPVDDNERDLPSSQYFGFFKAWDYITIIADAFTLYATNWIVFKNQDASWVVETLDSYVVILSVGCFGAWLTLLRFFRFHNKFFLLFATLYHAMLDVLAYLLCVLVLFLGFVASGYVVMAPYHVKFKTPMWAAETLFSVVNGDEMFATMNILEVKKTGGKWVWWFSRFYFGSFIAVFTIVVLNLLVAIFMSAYEAVREYYNQTPEDRDLGPVERALKHFLEASKNVQNNQTSLRTSLFDLMSDSEPQTGELAVLKTELGKLIKVDQSRHDIYIFRPKTLRVFYNEESDEEALNYSCLSCFCFCYSFPMKRD